MIGILLWKAKNFGSLAIKYPPQYLMDKIKSKGYNGVNIIR